MVILTTSKEAGVILIKNSKQGKIPNIFSRSPSPPKNKQTKNISNYYLLFQVRTIILIKYSTVCFSSVSSHYLCYRLNIPVTSKYLSFTICPKYKTLLHLFFHLLCIINSLSYSIIYFILEAYPWPKSCFYKVIAMKEILDKGCTTTVNILNEYFI